MNKVEIKFFLSHIRKAIWNLECAKKFDFEAIDDKIIEELKYKLIGYEIKLKEEK